jgi:excisionase family DNA binding protein
MTLLTQEEAARTLRISKTSLWRLRNRGKIRTVLVGKRVLFRQEELEKFIAEHTFPKRIEKI